MITVRLRVEEVFELVNHKIFSRLFYMFNTTLQSLKNMVIVVNFVQIARNTNRQTPNKNNKRLRSCSRVCFYNKTHSNEASKQTTDAPFPPSVIEIHVMHRIN